MSWPIASENLAEQPGGVRIHGWHLEAKSGPISSSSFISDFTESLAAQRKEILKKGQSGDDKDNDSNVAAADVDAESLQESKETVFIPEMLFGSNFLSMTHEESGAKIEFRGTDALLTVRRCSDNNNNNNDNNKNNSGENNSNGSEIKEVNEDALPCHPKVLAASKWTGRIEGKYSSNETSSPHGQNSSRNAVEGDGYTAFKPLECTYDWTFMGDYAGTVSHASKSTRFQLTSEKEAQSKGSLVRTIAIDRPISGSKSAEIHEDRIDIAAKSPCDPPQSPRLPMSLLSKRTPIVHFGSIPLFSDELADSGWSDLSVRIRTSGDASSPSNEVERGSVSGSGDAGKGVAGEVGVPGASRRVGSGDPQDSGGDDEVRVGVKGDGFIFVLMRFVCRIDHVSMRVRDVRLCYRQGDAYVTREIKERFAAIDVIQAKNPRIDVHKESDPGVFAETIPIISETHDAIPLFAAN